MSFQRKIVGYIRGDVIQALGLGAAENTPIFISESNIKHIRETHTDAYMKYFDEIGNILSHPDYIGIAGVHAPSIEYIKSYKVENELVNVAVRATAGAGFF